MRVVLKPIVHREGYTALVENEVVSYFREAVFDPLFEILKSDGVVARENEEKKDHSAVWTALILGTIWYSGDRFRGAFTAAISRELRALGARMEEGAFALGKGDLPFALRSAVAQARIHAETIHKQISATLEEMESNVVSAPSGLTFGKTVDKVTSDLQKQLTETVSAVPGLPPPGNTPPGVIEAIREQLTAGVNRDVKNFTALEISELRALAQQNLAAGGRLDRLADLIASRFGVAKRKAAIIAEAETSRNVSTFREERYKELGSRRYVWSTSHDEKVRPTHGESNNHRVLDGREFSWDSPPVVDVATGRRRHPGQDYGPCRCVALPVLNL